MTDAQRRALTELWPVYGWQPEEVPLSGLFSHDQSTWLEIGFGRGDALAHMSGVYPEKNFVGIEVHEPGVGRAMLSLEEFERTNVRVCREDAVEVLKQAIPDGSLERVLLFFPDPWHKKRHNKRRIVQTAFMALLHQKLAPGGVFHFATDWRDYAEWVLEIMEIAPGFRALQAGVDVHQRPDYRPETHFERRGLRLGHEIWDFLYQKI